MIEVRELQPLKNLLPINLNVFGGIVTEVREVQPMKTPPPMKVNEFGRVAEVREVQLRKIDSLIYVSYKPLRDHVT